MAFPSACFARQDGPVSVGRQSQSSDDGWRREMAQLSHILMSHKITCTKPLRGTRISADHLYTLLKERPTSTDDVEAEHSPVAGRARPDPTGRQWIFPCRGRRSGVQW